MWCATTIASDVADAPPAATAAALGTAFGTATTGWMATNSRFRARATEGAEGTVFRVAAPTKGATSSCSGNCVGPIASPPNLARTWAISWQREAFQSQRQPCITYEIRTSSVSRLLQKQSIRRRGLLKNSFNCHNARLSRLDLGLRLDLRLPSPLGRSERSGGHGFLDGQRLGGGSLRRHSAMPRGAPVDHKLILKMRWRLDFVSLALTMLSASSKQARRRSTISSNLVSTCQIV